MWNNIKFTVTTGMILATFYSLIVLGMFVLGGDSFLERYNTSIWGLFGVYYGAAIVGGVVVGALLPLASWRLGAWLVGVLGAVPLVVAAALAMSGPPTQWSEDDALTIVISAIVLGIIGAEVAWRWRHGSRPS